MTALFAAEISSRSDSTCSLSSVERTEAISLLYDTALFGDALQAAVPPDLRCSLDGLLSPSLPSSHSLSGCVSPTSLLCVGLLLPVFALASDAACIDAIVTTLLCAIGDSHCVDCVCCALTVALTLRRHCACGVAAASPARMLGSQVPMCNQQFSLKSSSPGRIFPASPPDLCVTAAGACYRPSATSAGRLQRFLCEGGRSCHCSDSVSLVKR
jgi:hypothetical protein